MLRYYNTTGAPTLGSPLSREASVGAFWQPKVNPAISVLQRPSEAGYSYLKAYPWVLSNRHYSRRFIMKIIAVSIACSSVRQLAGSSRSTAAMSCLLLVTRPFEDAG